jgi:hypothetical protein
MIRKLRTARDHQQWMLDLALNMRGRIAYVKEHGDGPWGDCEWTPPIKRGQAYF